MLEIEASQNKKKAETQFAYNEALNSTKRLYVDINALINQMNSARQKGAGVLENGQFTNEASSRYLDTMMGYQVSTDQMRTVLGTLDPLSKEYAN